MASGVTVNPECLSVFQELKLRKKYKYIIFNLNSSNTEIIVEKTSTESNYDTFLQDLPEAECRWGVYDIAFELEDGSKRQKLIFIAWSPDDARIKQKMVFASSREALRRSLNGINAEIQGTSADEVEWDAVLDKAKRAGH